jgi:hypothetical protein
MSRSNTRRPTGKTAARKKADRRLRDLEFVVDVNNQPDGSATISGHYVTPVRRPSIRMHKPSPYGSTGIGSSRIRTALTGSGVQSRAKHQEYRRGVTLLYGKYSQGFAYAAISSRLYHCRKTRRLSTSLTPYTISSTSTR